MDKQIGFIGAGNMARAIIGGIVKSNIVTPDKIAVFNTNDAKAVALSDKYQVNVSRDIELLAGTVDILFITVKPHQVASVLSKIKNKITGQTILISVAAGVTLSAMINIIGPDRKIIRVMPNTPALVNAGMSSCTPNSNVTADELLEVLKLLDSFGRTEVVEENLIHAVVGVSGSSPAYVFILIEAMADAAVLTGMPREKAYQFAAQAVFGSAKMVLDTGKHPAELKDMVCSPAGTTIEAVKTLEDKGFRAAVIDAIVDCVNRSKSMSKE